MPPLGCPKPPHGRRQRDVAAFCKSGLPAVRVDFDDAAEAAKRLDSYRQAVLSLGLSGRVMARRRGSSVALVRRVDGKA